MSESIETPGLNPRTDSTGSAPALRTDHLLLSLFASGVILTVYVLAMIAKGGIQEGEEWLTYELLATVIPTLSTLLVLLWQSRRERLRAYAGALVLWNGALVILLLAYAEIRAVGLARPGLGVHLARVAFNGVSALHLLGALLLGFLFLPRFRAANNSILALTRRLMPVYLTVIPPLVAILIFMYSPNVPGYPFISNWIGRLIQDGRLHGFLVVALAIAALVFLLAPAEWAWSQRHPIPHRRISQLALGAALAFAVLLFDIGLTTDSHHYVALVGPALHLRAGGIPFVDVHSQYGFLPFVLISWAFHFLPPNYPSAGVVVRVCTILFFASYVGLVYRLCRCRITGTLLAALLLLQQVMHFSDGLPSTQGYRYLLPMAMALALAYLPRGRHHSLWTLAALVISSFWSLEAFAYAAGAYIAFIVGMGLFQKRMLDPLRDLALLAGVVAAAHVAFALYLRATYGAWPRYDLYLNMVAYFQPMSDASWAMPIDHNSWIWAVYAAVYAVALSYLLYRALLFRGQELNPDSWWLVSGLLPATAVGVAVMSYFVGRSTEITIMLGQLPLFAVMLACADRLLWSVPQVRGTWRSFQVVALLAFAFLAAAAMDNYMSPFEPIGNPSFFRTCLPPYSGSNTVNCRPSRAWSLMREETKDRFFMSQAADEIRWPNIRHVVTDTVTLLDTLAPTEKRVLVFVGYVGPTWSFPASETALMYAGKWNLFPISSEVNDEQSFMIRNRVLNYPVALHDGELLIALKDETKLARFEVEILNRIKARWTLCPITETASGVTAFQLKSAPPCDVARP